MILIIKPLEDKYTVVSWAMERIDTTTREGKSHIDRHEEDELFAGDLQQCQTYAADMARNHAINRANITENALDELKNAERLLKKMLL